MVIREGLVCSYSQQENFKIGNSLIHFKRNVVSNVPVFFDCLRIPTNKLHSIVECSGLTINATALLSFVRQISCLAHNVYIFLEDQKYNCYQL